MTDFTFIDNSTVTANGQITLPENVRSLLGISVGDSITFVLESGEVKVVNSALYALKRFQKQMEGEGEKAGLLTDEDIAEWITMSRRKEEANESYD